MVGVLPEAINSCECAEVACQGGGRGIPLQLAAQPSRGVPGVSQSPWSPWGSECKALGRCGCAHPQLDGAGGGYVVKEWRKWQGGV